MTKQQKQYMAIQAVISFFINGILNGVIAYFMNRNNQIQAIPMAQNYVNLIIDIAITALIFAWIISWSVNANLKKANLHGVLEAKTKGQAWMSRRFKTPARYGWLLCIIMIPLLYALTCLGLWIFGVTHFTLWGYVLYKAGYTAIMGAAFTLLFLYSGFYAVADHAA
ncbi:MAG: hypothetical protein ACOX8S_07865 [Christensenellales bacterium]|jgi:hypothetical protein